MGDKKILEWVSMATFSCWCLFCI